MTIEQGHIPATEVLSETHKRTRLSKAGAVLTFASVPADIVSTDRSVLWAQNSLQHISDAHHLSHSASELLVGGGVVATITAQTLALYGLVSISKGARNAFNMFDEYAKVRQSQMTGPRKVLSKVVNSPLSFLNFVGDKFSKAGEKFEDSPSVVKREVGKTIVDLGQTNAMSTTGVVLYEMGETNERVPLSRAARLGITFGASWKFVTGATRLGYHELDNDYVRVLSGQTNPYFGYHELVGTIGRGAAELTSVYPLGVGTAFWTGVAAACLVAGYNAVNYADAQMAVDTNAVHASVPEQNFPPAA